MIIYVGVTISAVLDLSAITIYTIFDVDIEIAVCGIGIIAALYTTWGGFKAVVWAVVFQETAIIGGTIVSYFGLNAVGGLDSFFSYNADKLHIVLPAAILPWTALVIGLWIPNIYYWGLNQYIRQRTLAAKSLREGQIRDIICCGNKNNNSICYSVPVNYGSTTL